MKKTSFLTTAATAACVLGFAATAAWPGAPMVTVPDTPMSVHRAAADVAAPSNLTLEDIHDRQVTLSWTSPEAVDGYWDDFESHPDFAINSPGAAGWQYLDGDNCPTYIWNAGTFPGQGGKMAFLVMNGSEMSLADGLDMSTNPNFQPTSGRKMLVDFSAIGAANNDYLISPELHLDGQARISFRARSYTVSYGPERVRVGYSTTGTRQSDFTFLTTLPTADGQLTPPLGCDYLELPAAWTLIEYLLPADTRYVCVNCVSDDAFIFMLDDLYIGTNAVRPDRTPVQAASRVRLTGFNIYRNGERLNAEPYRSEVFTDEVPAYGPYTYTVTALWSDGQESAQSEALVADVRDVTLLPFEDTFSSYLLNYDNWSTPDDAQGNASRWTAGYYEYGLVNPSAVYSYSNLRYYDQSLESRQLRTPEPDNTWLRFTVQHVCYQFEGLDYLDVEVKGLNEQRWHRVTSLTNQQGSFPRTVFQSDISSLIASAREGRFQVRFRAHGADAQYIDYWYVDDVKVWCPVWGSASLTVGDGRQPLAGIDVQLTGDNGCTLQAVTDAEGCISLPQIEVGQYEVTILAEGYNPCHQTLTVGPVVPASLDVTLTYPLPELSTHHIQADDMATETTQSATFTLANHGTGPMHWTLGQQLPAGGGTIDRRFTLGPVFGLSGDLQSSIVFDGQYYYTSSWYFLGTFYKYDREGRFLEQFSIPEMYYMVYDFAYDGRYVYASDYSNRIFQLDMDERRIVSVITLSELPDLKITHLAYDPDRQGFWCGTFGTLVFVDRNGTQQSMESPWQAAAFGSAYDNVTPGGPYLWVADMTMPDDVIIDKVMLRQYSLNQRAFTGVDHVVNDMPGYRCGSATTGQNQVCGLTITDQLIPGQLTLVGVLQQSPSLVYTYNVCDFDTWLSVSPRRGTLPAGAEQQVTVTCNSLLAEVGRTYSSELSLQANPVTPEQHVSVTMCTTHATATPRPQGLTATAGQAEVVLHWTSQPAATGYEVLRDGQPVASCTDPTYTDRPLVMGSYAYTVRARYADGTLSLPSDEVTVLVRQGAPFYAPLDIEAQLSQNRDVTLTWQSPLQHVDDDCTLQWGTGENADQLGTGSSGYFYAGQRWLADELIPYRHKTITAVNVRICAPVTYLAARVYQDGRLVARTVHSGTLAYGEYNAIRLTRPVSIEPGSDYLVAVQVQAAEGIRPLGMDASPDYDGRGNLLSLDGTTWYNATQTAIEGCFNLSFTAEASAAAHDEVAPSAYRIYRDGEPIGETTMLTYDDAPDTPGLHRYTVTSVYPQAEGEAAGESPMSRPAVVRVLDLCNRQAPARTEAQVTRNRYVRLAWEPAPSATVAGAVCSFPTDLSLRPLSDDAPFSLLRTWPTQGAEMGVACDGQWVYTTVFNESGRLNVYDLTGHYVGKTVIHDDQLGGIRNLAWDGTSLWAADNSAQIHQLHVEVTAQADGSYEVEGALVRSYAIAEYSRHLAWIPDLNDGEGGFETGDWNTSILVSSVGSKLSTGPTYNAAAGTAYYDGCLYAFEQNNPVSAHCLAVYDLQSGALQRVIDLGLYLDGIGESFAGGASTYVTPDGMTVLCLCLQFSDQPSRLLFLDLSGPEGVTGYNVYRDGQLICRDTPLRACHDTLSSAADYLYQVSTRYIDGTESPLSAPTTVRIVEAGDIARPVSLLRQPSIYPYNVCLSFAEAGLLDGVTFAEDFEQGRVGQPYASSVVTNLASQWAITDSRYYGQHAVMAAETAEAWLVVPAQQCTWLDFVARCEAEAGQTGVLEVYYSTSGDNVNDFVRLTSLTTLPNWQRYNVTLPEGTEYVIVRKPAESRTAAYLDVLRLHTAQPTSQTYGYLVYRNGRQLTPEPVRDICYTDHNLPQGDYTYEVRAVSMLSAESDLTEPLHVSLDYDNGGQAPTHLRVEVLTEAEPSAEAQATGVQLTWEAPALGDDIDLCWHDGHNHDAAGLPNGGAYWAAVRWSPSDLTGLDSLAVSEVEVYVNQVPTALYVMLYEGGELRRQQLVERPQQYAFNRIALAEPLPLNTTKELRLVVYVEHNTITVPLGYDEGPCRAPGKSDIYSSDGQNWHRLGDADTGVDANWNFGLVLKPYALAQAEARRRSASDAVRRAPYLATAESSLNALLGYRVYVNRDVLHPGELQQTSWLDQQQRPGIPYLEYQVKAVYTQSGEVSSPIVRIQNPMQAEGPAEGRPSDLTLPALSDQPNTERYNLQGQRATGQQRGFTVTDGRVEYGSESPIHK